MRKNVLITCFKDPVIYKEPSVTIWRGAGVSDNNKMSERANYQGTA